MPQLNLSHVLGQWTGATPSKHNINSLHRLFHVQDFNFPFELLVCTF
jgi:hypothetical protein